MTFGNSLNGEELRRFSRWFAQMADAVDRARAECAQHPGAAEGGRSAVDPDGWESALLSRFVEYDYRLRRRRTELFDGKFFGEPAWDMLLDLFINRARGQSVATTSLCIASGVPPTTALRWIGVLEDLGLVRRYFSERDQRLHYVELTREGVHRIAHHYRERLRQLP